MELKNIHLISFRVEKLFHEQYRSEYEKFALDENYTTYEYLSEVKRFPGKLGCNLSHQLLLEKVLKESTTDWNLILEDDIDISNYDLEAVSTILAEADNNKSNYIQLFTNNKFLITQKKSRMIFKNLYEMIPQYHISAYFINKKGIQILVDSYPIAKNIDFQYNFLIDKLNSLCWINNIFYCMGSKDSSMKDGEFGSLIWENRKKVIYFM